MDSRVSGDRGEGRDGRYLHDGLFVGTVHLSFPKNVQQVPGPHAHPVGKGTSMPERPASAPGAVNRLCSPGRGQERPQEERTMGTSQPPCHLQSQDPLPAPEAQKGLALPPKQTAEGTRGPGPSGLMPW